MRYLFILINCFTFSIIFSQSRSWDRAPEGNMPIEWLQSYNNNFYFNDLPYSGFAFELHRNKNLKAEFQFKDGIKVSEKKWLENGELNFDYFADIDDKNNITNEYEFGDLYKKTLIKDDLKTISYYKNKFKTSETKEIIIDSLAIEKKWDEYGNLIEKSELKKGKYYYEKNGPSTMWYKNGNKMFECNYTVGWHTISSGKQITYYSNGMIAVSGEVNNYNQKEIWNFFDEKKNLRVKEICFNDSLRNRNFKLYNKDGKILSNNEIKLGIDYRTIEFFDLTKEYPLSENIPINHPDISITRNKPDSLNYEYGECIELKKNVNFIKIEFFDQGCGNPYTSFSFRDKNNKELYDFKNFSFAQRHLVISDEKLLSKTKFIYHSTCEGHLTQLIVLYD